MARFVTGNQFNTGDQVRADTLNNAVNNAKVSTDSVDNSSIAVNGSGVLSVKTSTSASDGVTFAKFQQIPANTVLVRDANSLGSVSAKAVADTQILIGDGTGFTSAALSGDATMTNAGAVTVSSVASGATGTTASSGDDSTKLATTAFVQDMRPKYVVATGGTHALTITGQSNLTVKEYNIADFTSSDPDFGTDKITGIVVTSYSRSDGTSNYTTATLPDGSFKIISYAAAYGSGDDFEVINQVTIPINADTTTFSFKYFKSTSQAVTNQTEICGFMIQPNL
jgi:hypothetical protein